MTDQPYASQDEIEGYRYGRDLSIAKLSNWMTANGFATGHGDKFDDLLSELAWQVAELREAVEEERAACASLADEGAYYTNNEYAEDMARILGKLIRARGKEAGL